MFVQKGIEFLIPTWNFLISRTLQPDGPYFLYFKLRLQYWGLKMYAEIRVCGKESVPFWSIIDEYLMANGSVFLMWNCLILIQIQEYLYYI